MIAKAKTRFIRVSPKKMRLLVDMVRGRSVHEAVAYLGASNKGTKRYLLETINSAYRNVKKDLNLTEEQVVISRITVDHGPRLSRYRSMSMGRAGVILHRLSHLNIELDRKAGDLKAKVQAKGPKEAVKEKVKNIISRKAKKAAPVE